MNKYINEVYDSPQIPNAWIVVTSDDNRHWVVKTRPDGWEKRTPLRGSPPRAKVRWSLIVDVALMLCGVPESARKGAQKS